ncbi:type II secretion system F family protein [Aquibaculum sediminis]|uniref:type II secretion system F family protein n=1 Tax=Aquibaculum sediminis TaxID=3231907 RepID=UPI003456859D
MNGLLQPGPALLALFAAVSVGALVIAVGLALDRRMQVNARIKLLARGANTARPRRNDRRVQFDRFSGAFRTVMNRMLRVGRRQVDAARHNLVRAGWRSPAAVNSYFTAKLLLPFGGGIGAAFAVYVLDIGGLSALFKIAAVLGAAIVGSYLPDLLIRNRREKRGQQIREAIPDTLDLMVICAEAGLSIDPTLERIGREMEQGAPAMSDELRLTVTELRYLPDRHKAWENLNHRTELDELRIVVNALMQTERYGTSLAQSLRVLSVEQREARRLRAEEKAARLPAIMTLPLIALILPALILIVIGPAALNMIDTFSG